MSYNIVSSLEWNGEEAKRDGRKMTLESIYEIGLKVEDQAVNLAPIDSGRLKGSITTQTGSGKGTAVRAPATSGDKIQSPSQETEVIVGTAVEYGPYQEFGTVRTEAQPFLRPALDMVRGEALKIVQANGRMHFAKYMRGA